MCCRDRIKEHDYVSRMIGNVVQNKTLRINNNDIDNCEGDNDDDINNNITK